MRHMASAYSPLLELVDDYFKRMSLPVSCTNVASGVSWNTAAVDDDSEKHEANAGNDFNDTKHELDLFDLASVLQSLW
jgi:hypothetical protein